MLIAAGRIIGGLLGAVGGVQFARGEDVQSWASPARSYGVWAAAVIGGALVGSLAGGLIGRWLEHGLRAIDSAVDHRSAAELAVGALGLVVGLAAAALVGVTVQTLPHVGAYLFLPALLLVVYLFTRIAARRHRDVLQLVGIRQPGQPFVRHTIVDASALLDGRLVDVVRTRFLSDALVVPAFVIDELQRVAASPDPLRRARGRRGLELVEDLTTAANGGCAVRQIDYPDLAAADSKLLRLAQEMGAAVITTDLSLGKAAQSQGSKVLNIDELADALKPAVLPGESLHVKVTREGREFDQGVGYLGDGTMVVIEGGRPLVGRQVDVEVTSLMQSPSGKMIFARAPSGGRREE